MLKEFETMNQKIALITGISGQDGAYLAKSLIASGFTVVGIDRSKSDTNLKLLQVEGVEIVEADICEEDEMSDIFQKFNPSQIYHLAAISNVGKSWEDPILTTKINCIGTLNLLQIQRNHLPHSRLMIAASGEIFGDNKNHDLSLPFPGFAPRNPYAVTKLFDFQMGVTYRQAYGLYIANVLLHNHESPLRPESFVTRKITSTVAKIKLGQEKKLILGNVHSSRDWGYAGDYVEAMRKSLEVTVANDYLVATGITHTVEDFVREAFLSVDIKNWQDYLAIDEKLLRPTDQQVARVEVERTQKLLAWKPSVTFSELVGMMVEADLRQFA